MADLCTSSPSKEVITGFGTLSQPKTVTVDCHIDIPWQMTKQGSFDLSLDNKGKYSQVDFPRMALGGLRAAVFALYLSDGMQDELEDDSLFYIYRQISMVRQQPKCVIVKNSEEALSCESNSIPIFLGLEGGRLISLPRLGQLGIRYLTITHNFNTSWADSSTDKPEHHGLTKFGRLVIRECNKLGIIPDVSHASDDTCWHVINESLKPVIASHSACRAIVDHPRNLSDKLIRAIAQTGGVVHIPFARRFIGPSWTCVADHIDHVVQLVGDKAVGIGSDLDGAEMADGIEDVTDWGRVVMEELSSRGYSDEVIANIAGLNTLRVLG